MLRNRPRFLFSSIACGAAAAPGMARSGPMCRVVAKAITTALPISTTTKCSTSHLLVTETGPKCFSWTLRFDTRQFATSGSSSGTANGTAALGAQKCSFPPGCRERDCVPPPGMLTLDVRLDVFSRHAKPDSERPLPQRGEFAQGLPMIAACDRTV